MSPRPSSLVALSRRLAHAAGALHLAINDVAGTFGDNQGALKAVVETK